VVTSKRGPISILEESSEPKEKEMSNRKTEIKTVDQCHREGRTEGTKKGRTWKRGRSSVGKREV